MTPAQYQRLDRRAVPPMSVPAVAGESSFTQYGCVSCHGAARPTAWPGCTCSRVLLGDGNTVIADDNYLRESILEPAAKIVAGYGADHAQLSRASSAKNRFST